MVALKPAENAQCFTGGNVKMAFEVGQTAAVRGSNPAPQGGGATHRGKSGRHRAGWRVTRVRYKPRAQACGEGEEQGHRDESWRASVRGETRQPPPGATPNRQALTRPVESAGRWLEPWSNSRPRGMAVRAQAPHRTRLIGRLQLFQRGAAVTRRLNDGRCWRGAQVSVSTPRYFIFSDWRCGRAREWR